MSENVLTGVHAADSRTAWLRRAGLSVPGAATLALVAVLSFRAGGYIVESATPVVLAWLAVVGIWALAARPTVRAGVPLLVALGALGLLALWTGLSVTWSVGPDLSWVAFNYAALYVAAAFALTWAGGERAQLTMATVGFLVCATAVATFAYLGKVAPDQVTHAQEYARLAAPIGYWNVLAVMLVMAAPVALALAARRGLPPYLRALSASVLALLLITLFFTFSRGGFAAGVVAIVVYFAAARERLSSLLSLACAAAPVGYVLWHLRDLETLFGPTTDAALRGAQGATLAGWSVLALGLPFVVQFGVAFAHARLAMRATVVRWVGVAVLALVVGACIGAPIAYMERQGGVVDWVRTQYTSFIEGPESEGGLGVQRVLVVSSNGRVGLYRVALDQYAHTPLIGTGAGTFEFSNYRFRETSLFVKHAHSQWFNALSELGIVGLCLSAVFVAGLAVAVVSTLVRRRRDRERGLLAACLAAGAGFVFHISGDWDWDMAAATLAFLLLAVTAARYRGAVPAPAGAAGTAPVAVVAAGAPVLGPGGPEEKTTTAAGEAATTAGRRAPAEPLVDQRGAAGRRRLPWPLAGLGAGLVIVLMASWLLPYLALRAGDRALAASGQGRLAVAKVEAQRAHRLDPLAVGPLVTIAGVEQRLGRPRAALAALDKAAVLQPDNFYVHYQRGRLLADSLGRREAAALEFRRALDLNPSHAPSRRQLELLDGG